MSVFITDRPRTGSPDKPASDQGGPHGARPLVFGPGTASPSMDHGQGAEPADEHEFDHLHEQLVRWFEVMREYPRKRAW